MTGDQHPTVETNAERRRPAERRWQWRTFPVFAAFVVGLLIASIINGEPSNTVAAIVQLLALLGVAYVLVHLFVMNVIIAGRERRRQRRPERGETADGDWEDEAVYPAEHPNDR